VDDLSQEMILTLEAKAKRRRRLAALPFPEKVAIVVQLQRMAAPIRKARGLTWKPWTCFDRNLESDDSTDR
jgi:hypothetical protein